MIRLRTTEFRGKVSTDTLGMAAKNILFVSSNGWDIAGADWFGYTTFWINRGGQPTEQLDAQPTATGRLLSDLLTFLKLSNP